jgi:hypothetical protein
MDAKKARWVHLAISYDKQARLIQYFIDGKSVLKKAIGFADIDVGPGRFFGWDKAGSPQAIGGILDEVCIYDKPLSEQEINAAMAGRP